MPTLKATLPRSEGQPSAAQGKVVPPSKTSGPKKLTYEEAVRQNLEHMGTPREEWRAVPIKGMAETTNGQGQPVSMPEFDFPAGYTSAPSLYKSQSSLDCACELCSAGIKNVFWLQNDVKKWVLPVGSECVTHFEEGKSGEQLAAEAKHQGHVDLFNEALSAKLRLEQDLTHPGFQERVEIQALRKPGERVVPAYNEWDSEAARKAWRSLEGLTTTKAGAPLKTESKAAMARWATEHREEVPQAVEAAACLSMSPEGVLQRTAWQSYRQIRAARTSDELFQALGHAEQVLAGSRHLAEVRKLAGFQADALRRAMNEGGSR